MVERPLGCFGRGLVEGVEFCVEDPNAEKVVGRLLGFLCWN